MKSGRRGFITVGVVLLALGIACSLVAIWANTSSQALSDAARLRDAQQAMELARSAAAEAWHGVQRAANDPDAPLARLLRAPAPIVPGRAFPLPELVHVRDLPGGQEATIAATARVESSRTVSPWPVERTGEIVLEARVRSAAGSVRAVSERRAFRVQRIGFPPPLDRWVLAPGAGPGLQVFGATTSGGTAQLAPVDTLNATPEGAETLERLANPVTWQRTAAYRVPANEPDALATWLARRMADAGRVNGIVYCEASRGQRLRQMQLAGRMLLVVTSGVSLADVTVASPAEDLVSVIAYDALSLSGTVQANLLRILPTDAAGTEIELSEGSARITGSLLDLCGAAPDVTGSLAANPHGQGQKHGVDPAQLVVLISPVRRAAPPARS